MKTNCYNKLIVLIVLTFTSLILIKVKSAVAGRILLGKCDATLLQNTLVQTVTMPAFIHSGSSLNVMCASPSARIKWEQGWEFGDKDSDYYVDGTPLLSQSGVCHDYILNLHEPMLVLESKVFSVKRVSYRDFPYEALPKSDLISPPPCGAKSVMLSKVCVYRSKSGYDQDPNHKIVLIGWTYPEDLDLKHLVPIKTQAELEAIKRQMPQCFDPAEDHTSD